MKEMGERLTGFPREFRHKAAVSVWEGLLHRLNLEFSEESRQNLLAANELLRQNSVVVYLNHTAMMEDVALLVSMVLTYLTNAKRIIGPVAMKHYDPARDPINATLLRSLKVLGIETFPIVQPVDIDKHATVYSDRKIQRMRENLKIVTANAVRNPGTVFGITPEGTRSNDGKLLPAKKGIGYLESYDANDTLHYLPVALALEKYFNHPKIEVGLPLRLGEMNLEKSILPEDPKERAQFLVDVHMQRLVGMLPQEMKGVYNRENNIT